MTQALEILDRCPKPELANEVKLPSRIQFESH